jgi:hypothetical protein
VTLYSLAAVQAAWDIMATSDRLMAAVDVEFDDAKEKLVAPKNPPLIVFVYIVLAATANLLFGYENRSAWAPASLLSCLSA